MKQKKKFRFTTKQMAAIAVLGALSAILMRIEFVIPFLPPFYKLDVSEVIVLIGGFAYGPMVAVMMEFMKNIIYVLFGGTSTMFIGELANILMGIAFVLPPVLLYHKQKTKKQALLGLIIGSLSLAVVGAFVNCFVLLPIYANVYQMNISDLVAIGTQLNGNVNSLWSFILLMTVPFNILKGILVSTITFISYKKIASILHGIK